MVPGTSAASGYALAVAVAVGLGLVVLGCAEMRGADMASSTRDVAVDIRHVEET